MRPITEAQGYIDVTKGSSEDFNKLVKSFSRDITNVFNETNENEAIIKRNMDIVIQENLFLQKKINQLNEVVKTVMAAVDKVNGNSPYYKVYKTFYSSDSVEAKTTYHDTTYGIMTLPYASGQKASLDKYPKDFLIKNIDLVLEYTILNGSDQVISTKTLTLKDDPELINIFDQDDSTFWLTEIHGDETAARVDFKLTISLPLKIMANLFVNSIGIKPHPIYSMTLSDIKYVDANNNSKVRIPTYPRITNGGEETARAIEQVSNLKFVFPTVTTSQLEFTMSQPYYTKLGTDRVFVIGFRGIDIENVNVISESESFITKLTIPGEGRYFSKVLEPTVYPIADGIDYGDLVTHELLYSRNADTSFAFGSEIWANLDTVYIKTTLRRDGETIPAIKGIEFNYLPK